MILLLPFLFLGVVAYLWWTRRNSTLTRVCRWRQVGRDGDVLHFRCAACGAVMDAGAGEHPHDCLRVQP